MCDQSLAVALPGELNAVVNVALATPIGTEPGSVQPTLVRHCQPRITQFDLHGRQFFVCPGCNRQVTAEGIQPVQATLWTSQVGLVTAAITSVRCLIVGLSAQ
jgi:hypothetical protein